MSEMIEYFEEFGPVAASRFAWSEDEQTALARRPHAYVYVLHVLLNDGQCSHETVLMNTPHTPAIHEEIRVLCRKVAFGKLYASMGQVVAA